MCFYLKDYHLDTLRRQSLNISEFLISFMIKYQDTHLSFCNYAGLAHFSVLTGSKNTCYIQWFKLRIYNKTGKNIKSINNDIPPLGYWCSCRRSVHASGRRGTHSRGMLEAEAAPRRRRREDQRARAEVGGARRGAKGEGTGG